MEDFFPHAQRGLSGFLGGINKTMDTMKWNDLWWNQRANAWGGALGYARSGVQGIGLLMGGFNVIEPYSRLGPDLTINQAQTIASLRALKMGITSAFAGFGFELGRGIGSLALAPFGHSITGSWIGGTLGSIGLGWVGSIVGNITERFILNTFGLLYEPYYQQSQQE